MTSIISIDGIIFDPDSLPQTAGETVEPLQIMGDQIQRKRNEWAISDAARNT